MNMTMMDSGRGRKESESRRSREKLDKGLPPTCPGLPDCSFISRTNNDGTLAVLGIWQ